MDGSGVRVAVAVGSGVGADVAVGWSVGAAEVLPANPQVPCGVESSGRGLGQAAAGVVGSGLPPR